MLVTLRGQLVEVKVGRMCVLEGLRQSELTVLPLPFFGRINISIWATAHLPLP